MRPSVLWMLLGLTVGTAAHARSASDSGKSAEDTSSQDTGDTATPNTTGSTGKAGNTGSTGTGGTTGGSTTMTEPTTFPGAIGYTAADLAGEPGGNPLSGGCGGDDDNKGKAALWLGLPLVIVLRRR